MTGTCPPKLPRPPCKHCCRPLVAIDHDRLNGVRLVEPRVPQEVLEGATAAEPVSPLPLGHQGHRPHEERCTGKRDREAPARVGES